MKASFSGCLGVLLLMAGHAAALGKYALERLREMKPRHPLIGDVRGLGLFLGVELVTHQETRQRACDAAEAVMYSALSRGLSFKLTMGNCLYSDMGRILCSIVDDSVAWPETVCGNTTKEKVKEKWGERTYQEHHNEWNKNGYNSFLVELAKYGLGKKDMAANLNLFSKAAVDAEGNIGYVAGHSKPGDYLVLRFEMDTLVLLHACPHPLNRSHDYPDAPVQVELGLARPLAPDDACRNWCDENRRGFDNNALYHLLKIFAPRIKVHLNNMRFVLRYRFGFKPFNLAFDTLIVGDLR